MKQTQHFKRLYKFNNTFLSKVVIHTSLGTNQVAIVIKPMWKFTRFPPNTILIIVTIQDTIRLCQHWSEYKYPKKREIVIIHYPLVNQLSNSRRNINRRPNDDIVVFASQYLSILIMQNLNMEVKTKINE